MRRHLLDPEAGLGVGNITQAWGSQAAPPEPSVSTYLWDRVASTHRGHKEELQHKFMWKHWLLPYSYSQMGKLRLELCLLWSAWASVPAPTLNRYKSLRNTGRSVSLSSSLSVYLKSNAWGARHFCKGRIGGASTDPLRGESTRLSQDFSTKGRWALCRGLAGLLLLCDELYTARTWPQ